MKKVVVNITTYVGSGGNAEHYYARVKEVETDKSIYHVDEFPTTSYGDNLERTITDVNEARYLNNDLGRWISNNVRIVEYGPNEFVPEIRDQEHTGGEWIAIYDPPAYSTLRWAQFKMQLEFGFECAVVQGVDDALGGDRSE